MRPDARRRIEAEAETTLGQATLWLEVPTATLYRQPEPKRVATLDWERRAWKLILLEPVGAYLSAATLTRRLGEPVDVRAIARVIRRARRAGCIERVGVTKPARPTDHRSRISLWRRCAVRG